MDLSITLATDAQRRVKPHPDEMGFGVFYSDHMFLMEWDEGRGWHSPRIEPYRQLTLDPAAMVLHYAQAAFEGFKAYPDQRRENTPVPPGAQPCPYERIDETHLRPPHR